LKQTKLPLSNVPYCNCLYTTHTDSHAHTSTRILIIHLFHNSIVRIMSLRVSVQCLYTISFEHQVVHVFLSKT